MLDTRIARQWDDDIVPQLIDYIRLPTAYMVQYGKGVRTLLASLHDDGRAITPKTSIWFPHYTPLLDALDPRRIATKTPLSAPDYPLYRASVVARAQSIRTNPAYHPSALDDKSLLDAEERALETDRHWRWITNHNEIQQLDPTHPFILITFFPPPPLPPPLPPPSLVDAKPKVRRRIVPVSYT